MSEFKSQSDAAPVRFKVGDRVVTYEPVVVSDNCAGRIGTVCKLLPRSSGEECVEIDYGYCTQTAYRDTDSLELVGNSLDTSFLGDKPDGGPAEYYDFPQGAITLNDLIEHKGMDFHRGNIFKACWRWGTKTGTSTEYDARKIIYSGARLLMKIVGVQELRKTLQKMLDDPQFNEWSN